MKYIVNNLQEMENFAWQFSKILNKGDNIILQGDLGAGKTTFTKGVAKALGINEIITSPTFTFMKSYFGGKFDLYHFDMYRVSDEDELYELGLNDYLSMDGICVIEWNKFEDVPNKKVVKITAIDENRREIETDEIINY